MSNIISVSFSNKRVLIRVDFNVPLDEQFNVVDDSRIKAAAPTILDVLEKKGRVILLSHLGRPKNGVELRYSLKHIVPSLSKVLGVSVSFCSSTIGCDAVKATKNIDNGGVLLLENVRFYKEETIGDLGFAKELAKLGDVYINDAFGVSHRNHASVSVVSKLFKERFLGNLIFSEVTNLNTVLKKEKSGFTAIIGGAKISSKINVIRALFDKVETLIIGGGMAYTFINSMGGMVGNSIVEKDSLVLADSLIKTAKEKNVSLVLPVDSINGSCFENSSDIICSDIFQIPASYIGMDIGPKSVDIFKKIILSSKTVIWNGPMGVFEFSNFETGTRAVAKATCEITKLGGVSIVGGGDSLAAINRFGLNNCVSFLSTGGGAMLSYLEGKELPGLSSIL